MTEEPNDYGRALALGRRAFHDRATDTICSCPENYLLAVGATVNGRRVWTASVPAELQAHLGAIVKVITLRQYTDDAEALADAVGAVLPPPTR